MVDKAHWQRKIVALLHDPPDKILELEGHQHRAFEIMEGVLGPNVFQQLFNTNAKGLSRKKFEDAEICYLVKKADQVSAAMDRMAFPGREVSSKEFLQKPWVRHPLAGTPLILDRLSPNIQPESLLKDLLNEFSSLPDDQTKFLWLWHRLDEWWANKEQQIGEQWRLIPADTRMVNHNLWHHLRMTAAVAASLPQPALLTLSVGPVQNFIFTARRLHDLWMGSYLLSFLVWKGLEIIVEKYGPDHVIYPNLKDQPLMHQWLSSKKNIRAPPSSLRISSLPNKILVILPDKDGRSTAQEMEKAIRGGWEEVAREVQKWFRDSLGNELGDAFNRHIGQFPEIYWSVYPLDVSQFENSQALNAKEQIEKLLNLKLWDFDKIFNVFRKSSEKLINLGTFYGPLVELTQRSLGSRKAFRNISLIEEPGEKCSLCGVRAALNGGSGGQATRDFWKEVWKKLDRKEEESGMHGLSIAIYPEGRERLCGICLVKRWAGRFYFRQKLNLNGGFPSTDSIAVASFVRELFERWDKIRTAAGELLKGIKNTKLSRHAFVGMNIPLVSKLKNLDNTAKEFVKLDGGWLFMESYEKDYLKRAYRIEIDEGQMQHLKDCLNRLYKSAEPASPTDYYAILMMDGDKIDEWISGTHPKIPSYKEILHPLAVKKIEQNSQWQEILEKRVLMSPTLHVAISEALGNFSRYFAPFVVEERYAGRLVYAGGDDVLALLPVADALPAARELRALFSGEAERQPSGEILVEFGSGRWSGWLEWNGHKLLTMGNRATASVGIIIAHRLHPLQDALRQLREAEEDAKKHCGQNAIYIRWLKRSGEHVQMGARFSYPEDCVSDTLRILLKFADLMQRHVSRGFATDLMQEAPVLAGLDWEAQEVEVRRLIKRRSQNLSDEQIAEHAKRLMSLAKALNHHVDPSVDPTDPIHPQAGIVELAKWLTFLRFLVGGGE